MPKPRTELQRALKRRFASQSNSRLSARYGQLENAALCRLLTEMRDTIVSKWEKVDPNAPVPDEINDDVMWNRARRVLEDARGL